MPRLKSSPQVTAPIDARVDAIDAPKVKLTVLDTDQPHTLKPHASPALQLQEGLNAAFNTIAPPQEATKIPLGWALLALGIGCAAFWGTVIAVAF